MEPWFGGAGGDSVQQTSDSSWQSLARDEGHHLPVWELRIDLGSLKHQHQWIPNFSNHLPLYNVRVSILLSSSRTLMGTSSLDVCLDGTFPRIYWYATLASCCRGIFAYVWYFACLSVCLHDLSGPHVCHKHFIHQAIPSALAHSGLNGLLLGSVTKACGNS